MSAVYVCMQGVHYQKLNPLVHAIVVLYNIVQYCTIVRLRVRIYYVNIGLSLPLTLSIYKIILSQCSTLVRTLL